MSTHIGAQKDEIANIVLMPGDPLRAKMIAETYLSDVKIINTVRNMLGYTGFYKTIRVTVMGSGMGIPSMGIYSYELFDKYDVDYIIRIGTAGSYTKELDIFDTVLVTECYSDSNYSYVQSLKQGHIEKPSIQLNDIILAAAKKMKKDILPTKVYCTDVYKREQNAQQILLNEIIEKQGCKCVEMESYSLFHNANVLNKQAACILTISDSMVSKKKTTSKERETVFLNMIEIALESIRSL